MTPVWPRIWIYETTPVATRVSEDFRMSKLSRPISIKKFFWLIDFRYSDDWAWEKEDGGVWIHKLGDIQVNGD